MKCLENINQFFGGRLWLWTILLIALTAGCDQKLTLKDFVPGELWLDNQGVHINAHGGGIIFHSGKYYWYGEHKVAGELGNTAQEGVGCYSSTDLVNWKNEGIALKVVENDTTSAIAKGCIIERTKVIYNPEAKKFVMWFHLELRGKGYDAAHSGVAISESATGPFQFVKSFRPNAGFWPLNVQPYHKKPVVDSIKSTYCGGKGCLPAHPDTLNILGRDFETGQMARDMNLFVDDDGSAYHVYASEENSTLHISKLTDDFLSCSGQYIRIFPDRYMEAPVLFKHKGKYYLIASDCTGWAPNAARSAVSDSIFGKWTELGNPCVGEGAELTFQSQSTCVVPVVGKEDAYIFMADRWNPKNAIDGRYVWLPLQFENEKPRLNWFSKWNINQFN